MLNIDLSNVSESGLPPPGEYLIVVDAAEVKDSKKGGQYINVRWKFLDGPERGGSFFEMYNIKDAPGAAEAAKAAGKKTGSEVGLPILKKMLRAAGLDGNKLGSASDLLGLTVSARIKIVSDDFGEKVRIDKYSPGKAAAQSPF